MKYLLFLFSFLFIFQFSYSQEQYSTDSKRALKYFEEGLNQYRLDEYDDALENINKAIDKDEEFVEAFIVKGQIFEGKDEYEQAINSYKRAIEIDPEYYPNVFYSIGLLYQKMGQYQNAIERFNEFLGYDDVKPALKEKANNRIESCEFAIDQVENPVDFKPENLGDSVNSKFSEYWPSISADGKTLVITRLIPREDLDEIKERLEQMPEAKRKLMKSRIHENQEDFFVSYREDSEWTRAQNIGTPLNTEYNEGAQSISADGKTMYFSACNKKDGKGGCDIYISEKSEGSWSEPENIGKPINTKKWESQPSISPDGQTLYFVSNRKGGEGKKDIWKSRKTENGEWGKPENLGDSINTSKEEMAPFIHMDNKTLYFASAGWLGMGSMDLFVSEKKGDTAWTSPKNLGYPINTPESEFGMVVNSSGNKAYYASDRKEGRKKDIYKFELPEKAKPVASSYMKGNVFDAESKEPLEASFELISMKSGQTIMNSYSRKETGSFLVSIPTNEDYVLNVSKEGYLFYSDNFKLEGKHKASEPYLKDIPLKSIKEGEKMILRNVFYETDSFKLESESKVELNKVFQLLTNNPTLQIEISGHTDNVGSKSYNKELSKKRARSVYDFLIEKGIEPDRLTYKGYGEEQPIDSNENPEGRAKNRRTEIKVIKE
ncbi:MAG: OmpA family protein [Bacteroidota bacterium]